MKWDRPPGAGLLSLATVTVMAGLRQFVLEGSVGGTLTRGFLAATVAAMALMVAPIEAQNWTNVTGNLAYKIAECGSLTLLSVVPNSPAVIAGVAGRDLWVNTSGTTWSRLSDVARSERIVNRPTWIVYDPADPAIFWESGVYNDAGIYKTTDGGKTFMRLGNIAHNDYVSVDLSDPERRTLLAGGYEQPQTVHRSLDGGQSWKNVGRSLPRGSGFSTHPFVIDARTYLVNVATPVESPALGIYRSKDGGDSWERVTPHGPPGPPLRTTAGVIYWAASGRLLRSTDFGATWTVIPVLGLRPVRPVELPDNRLAGIGESTIMVTADNGASWLPLGGPLPYAPDGIVYSAERKAFFIWRGDCRKLVAPNAVMSLDFDVSTPARP